MKTEIEFKPNTKYSCYHKPSGEEWLVLGIDKQLKRVCIAGFPPTIANMEDCENFEEQGELTSDEIEYRKKTFGGNYI